MLRSFREIANNYSVFFFDAYGVLKNSSGIMTGVQEVIASLRRSNHEVLLLTNDASRSPQDMAKQYAHPTFGELFAPDHVISSGRLAMEYLSTQVRKGRVAYLGKKSSEYYITSAGLEPVPISECKSDEELAAIILLDDEGFDWFADINKALNLIRTRDIPAIIANGDHAYPVNAHDIAVAVGALGTMIEQITSKTLIRFGKPDTMMFSYALARVRERRPDVKKRDILMVGDTLQTDILGANKFGLDTVLVMSGNTLPEHANALTQATGIFPTYFCESVTT